MGGSGLIVVVIVAAWALFLVPQWMHRRASAAAHLADRVPEVVDHDDDAEAGAQPAPSRRRFGRRHLARRTTARPARSSRWRVPAWVSRRRGAAPPLAAGHSASRRRHLPIDRDAAKEDAVTPAAHSSEARRPPRTAAARRRRLLGILAALTLVAAVAVGVGALANLPVPAWVVAIPGGLMVAYLGLLAVVRPGAREAPRSVREDSLRDLDETDEPEPDDGDHGTRPVVRRRELSSVTAGAGGVAAVVEAPGSTLGGAESGVSTDSPAAEESSTWTPVPVPTPTYVTAPRARRVIRTIDLSNPGSWTAVSSTAPTTSAGAASTAGASEAEAAEEYVVEHRRAVGD